METDIKFLMALQHVEDLSSLLKDNEYEQFFVSHLLPIKFELQRQLTNFKHHSKIKE